GGSACVGLWNNGKQIDSDAIYLLRSYSSGMPPVEPSIKIISPIEKGNPIGHIYTNEDEIGGYENKTLFTGPFAETARREYKIPQTRIEDWGGADNAVMWRFKEGEEKPTEVARAYFSIKDDNDIIYVQAFDEWTSCSVRITRGENILCPNTETSITGALEATTQGSMTVYILTIPITYTGDNETPYIIELQKNGTVIVSCELYE
ncbi:MAG: hypothetical protein IKI31_00835, partial [Treponema sp.]|nr:hypothetical protein [Treponema sp.]